MGYINFLLQFAQPTVPAEKELMQRLGQIGIGAGRDWGASKVAALLAAIDEGIADGRLSEATRLQKKRSWASF